MFAVLIDFKVKRGLENDFLMREKKLLEILKEKDGFKSYVLFKKEGEASQYVGLQIWESKRDNIRSSQDKKFKETVSSFPVLAEHPRHIYGEVISLDEGSQAGQ